MKCIVDDFKTSLCEDGYCERFYGKTGNFINLIPRWIPCSERLPEKDGLYLVTTSKGQVQVHVFNHTGNSKEYWNRCNMAWMPLPEPYGERRTDETD